MRDVQQVLDVTTEAEKSRSLLMNTGGHGGRNGINAMTSTTAGSGKIIGEDIFMAMKSKGNVALHIVSNYADYIYPKDIDIINTQCHGLQQLINTMVTIPLRRQPNMIEPKWFPENTAFIGKWK